jgi:hypothetical protein
MKLLCCGLSQGRYKTPHSGDQGEVDDRLIDRMFFGFANRVALYLA